MRVRIKKSKKREMRTATVIFAVIFAILAVLRLAVGEKKENFWRYSGLDKREEINLIIDTEPVGAGAIKQGDIFYISLEAVKEHIDPNVYYNDEEGRVIITTDKNVLRFTADATAYLDNDEPTELNFPVFVDDDGVYLPAETVESIYSCTAAFHANGLFTLDRAENNGVLLKNTRLYSAAQKGRYTARLKKGTNVYTYGSEGGFLLVKVKDGEFGGFYGYIPKENADVTANGPKDEPERTVWKPDGYISLMFDQISNAAGAGLTMSQSYDGVNVLCPTWFSFRDEGGEVINRANKDYVNWAHKQGYKVWGLMTDNFDARISHAVLADDETRHYAIKQMTAYAAMYELDGINIDFEAVPKADGDYWVQFLREFAPICHQNGLTLSCDLFVARPWSVHYAREKTGETVDYVIVMGYDEHYGGSDSAGTVASMDWSREAISGTVNAGVPAEKVILGIPFYTRIWTEGSNVLESKAYSMDAAYGIMEENGASFTYDEETEQDYAEYTDGEGRHRCWLETSESAKRRTEIAVQNGTAGIAAWKLRMQSGDTLAEIKRVLEGS